MSHNLPTEKLIVFAGVNDCAERTEALKRRNVAAVMASYDKVREGNWWPKTRDVLDSWQQYRYLDSGAFTLLNRGKTSAEEVAQLLSSYVAFLEQHLNDFDFVFDLDVDPFTIDGRCGVELTEEHREVLRDVAGDKLIPVWHPVAGVDAFEELVREYSYISVGDDTHHFSSPFFRGLIDQAHTQGVLVHGLGTTRLDLMQRADFDTADSTTWLTPLRFGRYGGRPAGDPTVVETARRLGYDPAVLSLRGPETTTAKMEVSIALLQEREQALNP